MAPKTWYTATNLMVSLTLLHDPLILPTTGCSGCQFFFKKRKLRLKSYFLQLTKGQIVGSGRAWAQAHVSLLKIRYSLQ